MGCVTQRRHFIISGCGIARPELSMGPFRVTRSNPTHQLTEPIQPNTLQVEKFGPNPTRPNTTKCNQILSNRTSNALT